MQILTSNISSISELKANPMKTVASGNGEAVAILNNNKPAFYCVPLKTYEQQMQNNTTPQWHIDYLQEQDKKKHILSSFKDVKQRLE